MNVSEELKIACFMAVVLLLAHGLRFLIEGE
jgi:hypothetical protein